MRIVILGNLGAGKTAMATRLADRYRVAPLDLDSVAWSAPGTRRPLPESVAAMEEFSKAHPEGWIMEGSYADLAEAALPWSTELRFLNPGIEVCVAHCREAAGQSKDFRTPDGAGGDLERLLEWARSYETRQDEFGLGRHRAVFDAFPRMKREFTDPAEMFV